MATKQLFITGNEAAVLGALEAGAKVMFGYPITPATEILQGWIAKTEKDDKLQYLQTEDEIAAGFGVIGAVLGGVKAFTASAGPGHILLQDPVSMAENARIPFVGIMMQRGGPSTGTVNFSQQEVNLAAFGGNGDGLRVVYSASSVAEMYEHVIKAFSTAWKYRLPTFVLGDGYLGKMKATVTLRAPLQSVAATPLLQEKGKATYIRNCYSSEEALGEVLAKNISDWNEARGKIAESESLHASGAKNVIIAHGLVASAVKEALPELRSKSISIGLFRPITLNPLDKKGLVRATESAKKIFIFESALNQFARIIRYELPPKDIEIVEIPKPAEGFTPEEIIKHVEGVL
ncbi:MAG TPA: ferredoxin oxidoreductase [bacterium]|nr:ferredoxin oxidoreductase [bacterium]